MSPEIEFGSAPGHASEISFRAPTPEETDVYVVDDETRVLDAVSRFLGKQGYRIQSFPHPEKALEAIRGLPPAVLVTDKTMPVMSGLDLAERALETDPSIGVIVMTGMGDEASAQQALQIGAVDYLTKPFELKTLARSVSRAVMRRAEHEFRRQMFGWLKVEVEQKTAQNEQLTLGVLSVLVNALEACREHFSGHSERVASAAALLSRELDMSPELVTIVRAGGLLHDIGMIAVPDRIVEKADTLTTEEYRELQLHCQRGADILEPLEHLGEPARYVLEHHERADGSGYPLGLEGSAISRRGQIVGLGESWIALREDRPYRVGASRAEAFATLAEAGERFAPELITALERVLERDGQEQI